MARFDSLVHSTRDGSWLPGTKRDASLGTLMRALDEAQVDRACLVGIAGIVDNDTVEAQVRQHPTRLVPIGSVNPVAGSEGDAVKQVRALAERGFAGIKLHPRLGGYDPLDPKAMAVMAAAGEAKLPVFLCTLCRQPGRVTRSATEVVDTLANAVPDTKLVLLHGGGVEALQLFELVRMHKNLVLDLSFTLLRYAGSSMDMDMRFLVDHLDQRLVVGSDFPDYTPKAAFDRFDVLTEGLDRGDIERVSSGNLTALFASWTGFR